MTEGVASLPDTGPAGGSAPARRVLVTQYEREVEEFLRHSPHARRSSGPGQPP
jgi:hypothetical protein